MMRGQEGRRKGKGEEKVELLKARSGGAENHMARPGFELRRNGSLFKTHL